MDENSDGEMEGDVEYHGGMIQDIVEIMGHRVDADADGTSEHEDNDTIDHNNSDANGDGDGEMFDISLPATHSYMGPHIRVSPSDVVVPGWRGVLPALGHPTEIFASETVPLRLPKEYADALDTDDHLFALVFPEEGSIFVSSDGMLCETYERSQSTDDGAAEEAVTLKVRATHRLRIRNKPRTPHNVFNRPLKLQVEVLGDSPCTDYLQHVRLPSVHALRHATNSSPGRCTALSMDAALTPWPSALYRMIDCQRYYMHTKNVIKAYFASRNMTSLPADPCALSVWAARHAALRPSDRRRIWATTGVIERLRLICLLLHPRVVLSCCACGAEIARHDAMLVMSSDGACSRYANPGGYTHDILTVRWARNLRLSGEPSDEYSWFPGYSWTICVCSHCHTHLGWKFVALEPMLRPHLFYGLVRDNVTPLDEHEAHRFIDSTMELEHEL